MTTHDHKRIHHLLTQSLAPTNTELKAELQRDLWPAMLRRFEQRSLAVPWFDWALAAAVLVCLALFPRAIPVLLYHL